jgi:hypothetical protein
MSCRQEQEEAEVSPAEVQLSRLEARLERIEQMLARLLSQQRWQGGSYLVPEAQPEAQEVDQVTFAQLCSVAQRGVESELRQVLKKYNQQKQKRGKRP